MKTKIFIRMFFIGFALSISACGMLAGSNNAEVEALNDQVDALSTQNVLLMEKLEEDDTGTSAEEAASATEVPTEEPTEFVIPTATPESLPTEPVMAGTPIIYDGWSIMVSKEIDTTPWNGVPQIGIKIYLRNLGMEDRVFRYANSAIRLQDNLGNHYPFYEGGTTDCEAIHHDVKNLTIEGEERVELKSQGSYCDKLRNLNSYKGSIPVETGHLIVKLDNFGPFTGVEVIIDL